MTMSILQPSSWTTITAFELKVNDRCWQYEDESDTGFRIIGGDYANINEYPWQVSSATLPVLLTPRYGMTKGSFISQKTSTFVKPINDNHHAYLTFVSTCFFILFYFLCFKFVTVFSMVASLKSDTFKCQKGRVRNERIVQCVC